jgi:cardiolipin synthase C
MQARAANPDRSCAILRWVVLGRWLLLTWLLGAASGCASLPANTGRASSTAFDQPERTPLGQLVAQRRAEAGARSESAFRLIDTVEIAFTSRLALIEGATHSLDLQYYAIHADASTEFLLQRIREAARRGVRVRILLDDFNSVGEDAQVLRLAFVPGIEVRLFNPLTGPRNSMLGRILTSLHDIPRVQKRMHNKVFIADNAWGITGGRNLGDRYFGSGERQNFVDLDVLAAGGIVRDMSSSFDRFWNDELAYPVQALLDPEELDALRKPPQPPVDPSQPRPQAIPPALPAEPAVIPAAATATAPSVLPQVTPAEAAEAARPPLNLRTVRLIWAPSLLMVDKPGKIGPDDDGVDTGETVIDGLLHLMQGARRDVLIVTPYFVPGERMMAVYRQMRERGVRIRVLTNSLASNDAPAAHAGYARWRNALLDSGVELYEMHSGPESASELLGSGSASRREGRNEVAKSSGSRASLHSKAVIIDGALAVIGSMNLDLRSQLKNSEVALVIRSAALSAEAIRQVENTFATGAYRVERRDERLYWRAPAGAPFKDATREPDASTRLRLLVRLLGPFAPDEML